MIDLSRNNGIPIQKTRFLKEKVDFLQVSKRPIKSPFQAVRTARTRDLCKNLVNLITGLQHTASTCGNPLSWFKA